MKAYTLEEYLDCHISGLNPMLDDIERKTHLEVLQSHMISGKLQGQFLKMMAASIKAEKILEIGTFTGYATLCLAEAVGESGKVVTVEMDEELAEIAASNFLQSPYGKKIKLVKGDAKLLLTQLMQEQIFDMVFIDADKINNQFYYDTSVQYLKANGLILVDNVLWKGKVLDLSVNDPKTSAIRAFNHYVVKDDRVEACILPLRDGLMFVRKK